MPSLPPFARRILPWAISIGLLAYVFGWLTDWDSLVANIRQANVPLFVLVTFLDKMLFFLLWTVLMVTAIRRLVGPISIRSLFALRGGSELFRTISNPLADGAFLLGLIHLTGGSTGRVILAASLPGIVHAMVLTAQVTIALPFLDGTAEQNRDVMIAAAIGWSMIFGTAFAIRRARHSASGRLARVRAVLEAIDFRAFAPMLGWFVLLAGLDVVVQWIATHAFNAPIPLLALAARIPILYTAFLIPSFGNFGTREVVWAALFSDYADRETLIAYAVATNTLFLIFHVLIGVIFLPRAIALLQQVREARREGAEMPGGPLVHDPGEP